MYWLIGPEVGGGITAKRILYSHQFSRIGLVDHEARNR
jgi:hypothetical protein